MINDIAGEDIIKFKEGTTKEEICFQKFANDLMVKYGDSDYVRLNRHYLNGYGIEQIELNDGSFITNEQIDKIIEQVNSYASSNGIAISNIDDVRANQNIMQIYTSSWVG